MSWNNPGTEASPDVNISSSSTHSILTSSNSTFSSSITGDYEGAIITVSDSNSGLGADGPVIIYREQFINCADGQWTPSNMMEGRSTMTSGNNGRPRIRAISGLPNGVGMQVGTIDSATNSTVKRDIILQDTTAVNERFEHHIFYWPTAAQTASQSLLNSGATWWIKGIWHHKDSDGATSSTKNDYFLGGPLWSGSTLSWGDGDKIASNVAGVGDTSTSGLKVDATHWIDTPVIRQFWSLHNPTPGIATGSKGTMRLIKVGTGVITSKDWSDDTIWVGALASANGVDYITLPGFVRGFNHPLGCSPYFADIYEATGSGTNGHGAAARVEITDSSVYGNESTLCIASITSWAVGGVTGIIHKGMLQGVSLVGKHVHIFDADNTHFYAGVLA